MGGILQLITIGAQIFQSERQQHYKNEVTKLLEKIQDVADSNFYNKDMNAKDKAERELILKVDELKDAFIAEATK